MASHFTQQKPPSRRDMVRKAGVPVAAASLYLFAVSLWEHKWKVFGGLVLAVGIALSIWLGYDVRGYLAAERKTEADAVLVNSVENERYVRSSKSYEYYYDNTYQFYVDDEPQEWSERSSYPGDETRHLKLWMDDTGTWHRFELSRSLIAAIGAVVVGLLLLIFA